MNNGLYLASLGTLALVFGGAGVCAVISSNMFPYKFKDFNYNIKHILQHTQLMKIDGDYIKARVKANNRIKKRKEDDMVKGFINFMAHRAFDGEHVNIIYRENLPYVDRIVDALNHNGFDAWYEPSQGKERFTNVVGNIVVMIPKED